MAAPIVAGRRRRTRQIRAAATLLLALIFLGAAFYKAYSYIQDDTTSPTVKAGDCITGTAEQPVAKPSTVTINVYNATTTAGLAAKVAATLRERGFTVAEIDNDPLDKKITASAEIRYGDTGRPAARTARLMVKDAKMVNDKRTDETVDLVLGEAFTTLADLPSCSPKKS